MQPHVKEFLERAIPLAKEVQLHFGIPYGVVVAQSALETGWGQYVKGSNYFGIKGHGQEFATHEYINGVRVDVVDSFRAYYTMKDSFMDYGHFLTTNRRYEACFLYAQEPERFAEELQKAGYATDPEYANKLISIMTRYELLDVPDISVPDDVEQTVELPEGEGTMFDKLKGVVEMIGILRILIGLVQPIKELIEIVEELFAGEGDAGPQKKAAVLEILATAIDTIEKAFKVELPRDTIISFADSIIDMLVRLFNVLGIFKRGADTEKK